MTRRAGVIGLAAAAGGYAGTLGIAVRSDSNGVPDVAAFVHGVVATLGRLGAGATAGAVAVAGGKGWAR